MKQSRHDFSRTRILRQRQRRRNLWLEGQANSGRRVTGIRRSLPANYSLAWKFGVIEHAQLIE